MIRHKAMKLQNPKSGRILCAHKPYYLMPGHIFSKTKTKTKSKPIFLVKLKLKVNGITKTTLVCI